MGFFSILPILISLVTNPISLIIVLVFVMALSILGYFALLPLLKMGIVALAAYFMLRILMLRKRRK